MTGVHNKLYTIEEAIMLREKDIAYSNGKAWVWKGREGYYVMVNGVTHSESDSCYDLNEDGLSIAKARCDYLAKRRAA
jgi:hypothetical protein